MAITYVGGQAAGRGNPTAALAVTFALTGGSGSTPAADDLVVVAVAVGGFGASPSLAITTPAGYTALGQLHQAGATERVSFNVSYKRMGATPDATVTIPTAASSVVGQAWTIQVFRGVSASPPLDVAAVAAGAAGTGRPDPAAITPITAGAWVVVCGAGASSSGLTYTAPTGYATNFLTSVGNDTIAALIGSGYQAWTGGTENPAPYTGGTTDATNSWAAYTLALRSDGGPTPGLTIAIAGVEWKFRHDSMSIVSTLNGRDTLSGIIDILDDSDPPTLNQEITVTEDGVRIFGGPIKELEYRAITSDPDASKDLMVTVGASDFNSLADDRTIASMTSPGGLTLKEALQQLVPQLPTGVTLSPAQVDGPVLPSFAFTLQTGTAILDELSKLTEFVWEIDYYKVLTMWQPGTVAAPFNITDGDQKVWGDIVIRPIASDYANRIIVRAGRDGPHENVFAWYTDGTINTFPMYLYVLQHFGQVLVDTPLETVPGESYESVGAPGSGAIWEFHDGPRYTQYLSRAAGPPAAGNPVGVVPYPLQFKVIQEEPIVVTADNLAEQALNGIVEKLVDQGPSVSSWWELQAIADSLLGRYGSRRYTVQYSTRETGLRVGQSQTMSIARRNLSGPYFITDVETRMVGATILKRTVTLNETELFQGSWRDTYKLWAANSSGGGGGSVAVGSTVPIGGTPVPHHAQHEPGGMDPMTVDSTASIGSLRTLGTGVNQAAPGEALLYFLGASAVEWQQAAPADWVPAGGVQIMPKGMTAGTVTARLRALSGTVTARLYDLTAGAAAGTSSAVASTAFQTVTFAVTIAPGHTYELQLLPSLASVDVQGIGCLSS